MIESDNKVLKEIEVYSTDENSTETYITKEDVYTFVRMFKAVLDRVFPKFKFLNDYTKAIVKIFSKLNIPIPWTLSSGALISQSYLNYNSVKLKPFSFIN